MYEYILFIEGIILDQYVDRQSQRQWSGSIKSTYLLYILVRYSKKLLLAASCRKCANTHDYVRMGVTVMHLEISRHQLSI